MKALDRLYPNIQQTAKLQEQITKLYPILYISTIKHFVKLFWQHAFKLWNSTLGSLELTVLKRRAAP